MSAYLVEDHHVDFMLSFLVNKTFGQVFWQSRRSWLHMKYEILDAATGNTAMDIVGNILIAENYRSLAARYGDNTEPHRYRFKEHPGARVGDKLAICVQVLKACDCFDYQACESSDYEQTDAARMVQDIRKFAISSLPG